VSLVSYHLHMVMSWQNDNSKCTTLDLDCKFEVVWLSNSKSTGHKIQHESWICSIFCASQLSAKIKCSSSLSSIFQSEFPFFIYLRSLFIPEIICLHWEKGKFWGSSGSMTSLHFRTFCNGYVMAEWQLKMVSAWTETSKAWKTIKG